MYLKVILLDLDFYLGNNVWKINQNEHQFAVIYMNVLGFLFLPRYVCNTKVAR
jgi:hypothetical protein